MLFSDWFVIPDEALIFWCQIYECEDLISNWFYIGQHHFQRSIHAITFWSVLIDASDKIADRSPWIFFLPLSLLILSEQNLNYVYVLFRFVCSPRFQIVPRADDYVLKNDLYAYEKAETPEAM